MKELHFFSCLNCEYAGNVEGIIFLDCSHPAVAEMHFEGDSVGTYTPEDWLKVDELANKRLNMKTATMGDEMIPNFEFPFKFDPIMIIGCDGFKQREYEMYYRFKDKTK